MYVGNIRLIISIECMQIHTLSALYTPDLCNNGVKHKPLLFSEIW